MMPTRDLLWLFLVVLVTAIQQPHMDPQYFQHLKDMHSFQNYQEELQAIEQMLDQFRRLPLPDQHHHLAYFQNRPEFQHLSRYFQFAGLLHKKESMADVIETLMHLQHQTDLDHTSVIFTQPEIHPQARLTPELRDFLTRMEIEYDIQAMVDHELEHEVFPKEQVDILYSHMKGDKKQDRGGPGYYSTGHKKLSKVKDSHRQEYNRLFNDYLQRIAHGSDFSDGPQRMHQAMNRAKAEQESKRKVRGRLEEQRDLVHDVLDHHTTLPLDKDDHHQVMSIGRQVVDKAIETNHSYTHLHQFTHSQGKVHLTNTHHGTSYFQVDQRYSFSTEPEICDDSSNTTDTTIIDNESNQRVINDLEEVLKRENAQKQAEYQQKQKQEKKEEKEKEKQSVFHELSSLRLEKNDFGRDNIEKAMEEEQERRKEHMRRVEQRVDQELKESKRKKEELARLQELERTRIVPDGRFSFMEQDDNQEDKKEEDKKEEDKKEEDDDKDDKNKKEDDEIEEELKDEIEALDEKLKADKQKVDEDTELKQEEKEKKKEKLQKVRDCKLKKKKKNEKKKKKALAKLGYLAIPNDFISPLIMFPLSIPIAIIKGIILLVLEVIGQIIHICLPAGPLTIMTCPEAAASNVNIYMLFQWEDKNKIITKQFEGFQPLYLKVKRRLYNLLFSRFKVNKKQMVLYYVCGVATFTLVCSQVWSGCDLFAWLFTNPPILVIPFLSALPNLAWNNIIPGDKPFCFMNCIYGLVACLGMLWGDLNVCAGLFNLDNIMRMMTTPNLLIFAIFSFIPGFCDVWPFILNLWKLAPLKLDQQQQIKDAKEPEDLSVCEINETDPFTPDFQVKVPTYPYEVGDIEKDYEYKNWEFEQKPGDRDRVGFNQSLDKNPDEASYEDQKAKAEEMYERTDKSEKKDEYVRERADKMVRADISQEKKGKPGRINGLTKNEKPGQEREPIPK